MRAIQVTEYGDDGELEVVETDALKPGPRQVQIDVAAIGVNFSDVMQRRGDYYGGPEPPYTPGTEVAGTISAVGDGVEMDVGDRVAALVSMDSGAYAEYVVAGAGVVFPIPDAMSFEAAAGFPVQFTTAHCALHEWGGLEEGDTVLVHAAAGGVGTAAVQIANADGAEIVATASTDEKLSLAADLGADHTINYTEADFREVIDETLGGVDLVLDGVGGSVLSRSIQSLTPFGTVVTYGQASRETTDVDNRDLFFENRSVHGFHLGHALAHRPKQVFSAIDRLTELLSAETVEVVIDRSFPLERAADALAYVEDRKTRGKVVLTTE
jgi:NADPH2:quinone reductase